MSAVFAVVLCPSVRPSVRPSVGLSVRRVRVFLRAKDIVKLLSRPGSAIILGFLTPSADTQLQGPENTSAGR